MSTIKEAETVEKKMLTKKQQKWNYNVLLFSIAVILSLILLLNRSKMKQTRKQTKDQNEPVIVILCGFPAHSLDRIHSHLVANEHKWQKIEIISAKTELLEIDSNRLLISNETARRVRLVHVLVSIQEPRGRQIVGRAKMNRSLIEENLNAAWLSFNQQIERLCSQLGSNSCLRVDVASLLTTEAFRVIDRFLLADNRHKKHDTLIRDEISDYAFSSYSVGGKGNEKENENENRSLLYKLRCLNLKILLAVYALLILFAVPLAFC